MPVPSMSSGCPQQNPILSATPAIAATPPSVWSRVSFTISILRSALGAVTLERASLPPYPAPMSSGPSGSPASPASLGRVREYLLALQDGICAAFEALEPRARFGREDIEDERGGLARPRVMEGGDVLERAGVLFSHARGAALPAAATARRPELAGRGYEALSVSLITHPRNPYAPTSHMNVRFFAADAAGAAGAAPGWWFGGGFDLTPYYGFDDDAVHWHETARRALEPFGADVYPRFKAQCDEYFFLKHRGEPRGIGGVFFDDHDAGGFESAFALMRAVGDHYAPAYLPILERRKDTAYTERERDWQLYRRGRYVEFNLIWDRGTLFGLQAGGRAESILASLPPEVRWRYRYAPQPGSPEARLLERYLAPRDWV